MLVSGRVCYNSTYRGQTTPVTHLFSAIYRGYPATHVKNINDTIDQGGPPAA